MAAAKGKGIARALSEGGLDSGQRGTKRAHGSGNYFTMADVEKKIKKALFTEKVNPRRANETVERKNNKLLNPKSVVGEKGGNQGKRKTREFNGGEEEVMKKRSINDGRIYKPKSAITKNDKIGSGVAEADFQPRRPQ
jgi:hypothetical protein